MGYPSGCSSVRNSLDHNAPNEVTRLKTACRLIHPSDIAPYFLLYPFVIGRVSCIAMTIRILEDSSKSDIEGNAGHPFAMMATCQCPALISNVLLNKLQQRGNVIRLHNL